MEHVCRTIGRAGFVFRFLRVTSRLCWEYLSGTLKQVQRWAQNRTDSPRRVAITGEQLIGEHTNVRSGRQIQNYNSLAWRSPQMSIAIAPSH